jgi:putative ABC transport system permease protein
MALRIARREVGRARGRSALVLALVMLPVLVVTVASTLLRTAEVSRVEALPRELGAAAASIAPPLPVGDGDDLGLLQCPDGSCFIGVEALPRSTVRDLAAAEAHIRAVLGPDARLLAMPSTTVGATLGDRSVPVRVTEADLADPVLAPLAALQLGRLPAAPGEVVVTQPLAEAGAQVGSTITLGRGSDPVGEAVANPEATVVGVVRSLRTTYEAFAAPGGLGVPMVPADGYPAYSRWLVDAPGGVSWEQVRALNAERMLVDSRAVITDPPSRAELAGDPVTAQLVDIMQPGGSSTVTAVLGLLVAMVALEVILLAGPAFAVGAAQQTRALGLIAAQGGTARQLRRVVLGQAVVLGGLAAVLGVMLGLATSAALVAVLPRLVPSISFGPFDLGWGEVALVAALGFASAVIAALAPARAAARMDPVRAMAGRRPQPRSTRRHPIAGLLLVGVGIVLAGVGAYQSRPRPGQFGGTGHDGSLLIAAAAVVAILGVVLLAPLAVRLLARLAGRAPLAGRYALRDMARNQLRTAPAVAAVAGVVAGAVALGISTSSDAADDRSKFTPAGPIGDAVVQLWFGEQPTAERERVWAALADEVKARFPDARVTAMPALPDPWAVGALGQQTLMLTDATVLPADATGVCAPGTVGAAQACAGDGRPSRYGAILVGADGLAGISDLLTVEQRQRATEALASGTALVLRNAPAAQDTGTARFDLTRTDPQLQDAWPRLDTFTVPAIGVQVPGVSLPAVAVIPEALAQRAGVTPSPGALLVDADPPLDEADRQRLQFVVDNQPAVREAAVTGQASVGTGWANELRTIQLILFAAAGVLVLAGSLTAALLALSDARADFATLGAVGGAPRIRRRISGAYAAAIAFIGAALGAAVGFIPGVAITYPLTTGSWTPAMIGRVALDGQPIADHYLVIPWPIILTLVIGLPILVGLFVAATTRSRLPMVARID